VSQTLPPWHGAHDAPHDDALTPVQLPLHRKNPLPHLTEHPPSSHAATPFAVSHDFPHAPQFSTSVPKSTHAPASVPFGHTSKLHVFEQT
jgi:hypothetical protein